MTREGGSRRMGKPVIQDKLTAITIIIAIAMYIPPANPDGYGI